MRTDAYIKLSHLQIESEIMQIPLPQFCVLTTPFRALPLSVGIVALSLITLLPSVADDKVPQPRTEQELRDKLVGSWKIVSASFDGKPSELHRTSITIKHITPVHVIWIGYQPEDRRIFRSAGGSWTTKDMKLVETMRYGLDEKFRESSFGNSLAFDCRFEEDRWIQSGKLPNGVFLEEIWQRVKPEEDVSMRPADKK